MKHQVVLAAMASAFALSACSGGAGSAEYYDHHITNSLKQIKVPSVGGKRLPRPDAFNEDVNATQKLFRDKDISGTSANYTIDGSKFNREFQSYPRDYNLELSDRTVKMRADERVYNLPYSIVYGVAYREVTQEKPYKETLADYDFMVHQVTGSSTSSSDIPDKGKATYNGVAFAGDGAGKLRYEVDFARRTGSGVISGIPEVAGEIHLHSGKIDNHVVLDGKGVQGIRSTAHATASTINRQTDGRYELGFFGPKAEEVAGRVTLDDVRNSRFDNGEGKLQIGFGGTRGAITK